MSKFNENVDSETLSIEQAAQLMRIGYEAMKRLIDDGEVPAVILNQRHAVLLRSDVLNYIREKGRVQAEERRQLARRKGRGVLQAAAPRRGMRRNAAPDLSAYEAVAGNSPKASSKI